MADYITVAKEKARALLPAPDSLTEQAYTAEVVKAAIDAAGSDDANVRMQAERIARHAWSAWRPRLASRKPIDSSGTGAGAG